MSSFNFAQVIKAKSYALQDILCNSQDTAMRSSEEIVKLTDFFHDEIFAEFSFDIGKITEGK